MASIIYALTNEAMPGFVKIGKTTRTIEERLREFYSTPVPYPFQCVYAAEVVDLDRTEKLLHNVFNDKRVSPKREFFKVDIEQVISAIQLAEIIKEVTPKTEYFENKEDEQAVEKSRESKSRINLSNINVPVGSILTHLKSDTATCMVTDDNRVIFRNENLSLSASAHIVLKELGYTMKVAQGPAYWVFEGETLASRRERFEEAENA